MVLDRRRRRWASFTMAAGGTTFTNAIRFDTFGDIASVAAHAAYNDLPAFTMAVLVRWDAAGTGCLMTKGSDNTHGWAFNIAAADWAGDFTGICATTPASKRATTLPGDNTWQWFFFAWDRTAHKLTRAMGPMAGAITDIHRDLTDGSVGAAVAEVGPLILGNGTIGAGAFNMEIRFLGVASIVLSHAQMQAVADDAVAQAALFVDYWKPGAGNTSQTPSAKSVLPALVYSGATLV